MKRFFLSAAFALAMSSSLQAQATPITWTLDPTVAKYSSTVWGTFTYDADTATYSSVAMHFSFSAGIFGANAGSDADHLEFGVLNNTGLVTLEFLTPLSNAGGTIAVDLVGTEYGNPVHHTASVHAPSTAVGNDVPEPGSIALAGLALAAAAAARRRRTG